MGCIAMSLNTHTHAYHARFEAAVTGSVVSGFKRAKPGQIASRKFGTGKPAPFFSGQGILSEEYTQRFENRFGHRS